MIQVSNINSLPKPIRRKMKLIGQLWSKGDIVRLRELRTQSKDLAIDIYHHSQGTDSYFHDLEGRYYSWAEVELRTKQRLDKGEVFTTVVIPYRAGIAFRKGSINPQNN